MGCATGTRTNLGREIFPPGVYRQRVDVVTEGSPLGFDSIIRKTTDGLSMVSLNEMGVSLFKISSMGGAVREFVAITDEVKKKRPEIERLFRLIQQVFSLREKEVIAREGGYFWKTSYPTIEAEFKAMDFSGVPRDLLLVMPGKFRVHVETDEFTAIP